MIAQDLLTKAERAVASAKVLLEPEQAQWAVQQAVNFVETIQLLITA